MPSVIKRTEFTSVATHKCVQLINFFKVTFAISSCTSNFLRGKITPKAETSFSSSVAVQSVIVHLLPFTFHFYQINPQGTGFKAKAKGWLEKKWLFSANICLCLCPNPQKLL